ncbi:MAG TPA: PAS domain-containing protein, partial [Leptospiraceae bacterium]|nr:PAS domain-containing protein [Leptospiraceae bacterium]
NSQGKAAEIKQQIQETEKKAGILRKMVDSSSFTCSVFDSQYRIVEINHLAAEVTKAITKRDVRTGDSILDYVSPIETPDFLKNSKIALEGKTVEVERSIKGPDSQTLWYQFTYTPFLSESGETLVIFTGNDITHKKRSLEILQTANEGLEALIKRKNEELQSYHRLFDRKINEEQRKIFQSSSETGLLEKQRILSVLDPGSEAFRFGISSSVLSNIFRTDTDSFTLNSSFLEIICRMASSVSELRISVSSEEIEIRNSPGFFSEAVWQTVSAASLFFPSELNIQCIRNSNTAELRFGFRKSVQEFKDHSAESCWTFQLGKARFILENFFCGKISILQETKETVYLLTIPV